MPIETLTLFFVGGNLIVTPLYALMAFFPHASFTRRVIESLWSIAVPALLEAVLVGATLILQPQFSSYFVELYSGMTNRVGVEFISSILGSRTELAVLTWLHLIAMDMVAARWAYLDSRERNMSAWFASPAILAILLVGPVGLVLYLFWRAIYPSR